MNDIQRIKSDFPIFKNNPKLVFLDNASTTQKPGVVIDSLVEFYTKYNSNVHRGLYELSDKASGKYEKAREVVANFINAEPEEIVFTSGTTDSINAIASMLSRLLPENALITLTELEHHANILPWQRLKSSQIRYAKFDEKFNVDYASLNSYAKDSNIISVTHMSNVTGTVIDTSQIERNDNSFLILDAAQSIAHTPIDVKKLNVDFLCFSGHKIFAPTGVGVLYIKKSLHSSLEPFRVGGGMISEVQRESSNWASAPQKFEAGTPPIAEAIALGEAINYINNLGFENIKHNDLHISDYIFKQLSEIDEIRIFHSQSSNVPVVSFEVQGIHAHDIAQYLGDHDIAVRAGHHCTHILHREVLKSPSSVRISSSIYNSKQDIDSFIEVLKQAIYMYRKTA